jgi:multisubunit Na+/H+ antiporter MnhB subunit
MKKEEMIMSRIRNRHKRLDGFQRLILLLVTWLTTMLGIILLSTPKNTTGLADAVAMLQKNSGVESPVTAVLLNFRGYDTLLEVMVLLLAVIGVWSLTKAPFPEQITDISPVQMGVVRLLAPFMCLVAAYLVWQGSHLAGGAFQGGAILGAAGVLMLVAELPWLRAVPVFPLRVGLVLGPLFFVGIALFCLFRSGDFLGYPEKSSGWLILLIETSCAISIGLTLASLFSGGRPEWDFPKKHKAPGRTCKGDRS